MNKSGFFGNIAKLAGGVAVGQGITVLASPILTRLYEPGEFGVLAVYAAIVGGAGSIASLSYHQAIPLPEDDRDAANLFGLSIAIIAFTFIFFAVTVAVFGEKVSDILGVPELAAFFWLVPLGIVGLSIYETATQWAIRQKSFPVIARTSAARGVLQSGTQVIAGFAGAGAIGLLLGQLMGQWAGAGSLFRNARRKGGAVFRCITPDGVVQVSKRYFRFLRFTSPSNFFNVVGRDSPPLILAYFFGSSVAGLFALGERVLMIPITLIAKSASQVFTASASEYHSAGRLNIEVQEVFTRMLRLALAPVIILGISSPILFSFLFGEEWMEAGRYVRWLSPWLLFVFISLALGAVVYVLERQRIGMWFQGLLATGRIIALILGGLIGEALVAIAIFGIVSGLMWAAYLVWLLLISGLSVSRLGRIFVDTLPKSVLFAVPVLACQVLGAADVIFLGSTIVCGASAIVWSLIPVDE